MTPETVAELCSILAEAGVRFWVDGGWGIDALLNEQTRSHKDLDLIVCLDDLVLTARVLEPLGFTLSHVWEENRWVQYPAPLPLLARVGVGPEVATAFVLSDAIGREVDVHVLTFDTQGNGVPAWNAAVLFSASAFAGCGTIAGRRVPCLSADMQMRTHTGYPLQEKDRDDLRRLHERLGVEYLPEHRDLLSGC